MKIKWLYYKYIKYAAPQTHQIHSLHTIIQSHRLAKYLHILVPAWPDPSTSLHSSHRNLAPHRSGHAEHGGRCLHQILVYLMLDNKILQLHSHAHANTMCINACYYNVLVWTDICFGVKAKLQDTSLYM